MSNNRIIDITTLAQSFRALANPHRLGLFLRLARCCGAPAVRDATMRECVGVLARDLDLAPSTVSHHLKELRRAGLIEMERKGQQVECWVETRVLVQLAGFFANAAA